MNKTKLFIIFIILIFTLSAQSVSIAVIKGTVNKDTVRVRKEASTDSSIVELVSIGDKITITGESGDWYKVKVNNKTGYIRKDLLDLDDNKIVNNTESNEEEKEDNTTQSDSEKNNENIEQNNEEQNNKSEDNKTDKNNQETNDETEHEKQETVMGEDKAISKITLADEELKVGAKKKIENEVKLKILPLPNSNNIVTQPANTEVTILEIVNNWCKVEAEGESGWIRIDQ